MKTYTIEQLEKAWSRAYSKAVGAVGKQEFFAELTRPKFSEGQVMHHTNTDGYTDYCVWGKQVIDSRLVRPLNQAEVGPDWVPREAAMKLRKAMLEIRANAMDGTFVLARSESHLKAFDEVVK